MPENSSVNPPSLRSRIDLYLRLMRFDRPIGTMLLLWPTLWALWLAADGIPKISNLVIFTLGVFLMRSAGCVINDYADRNIDGLVSRTKLRPLATGEVSTREALAIFVVLAGLAFLLVLMTNQFTVTLSFVGMLLASTYPFMKRYTYLPQVVLGAAFAWSIPMAYAAESAPLTSEVWLLYLATLIWTVAYDTIYAMVDRDDDLKIGVKSTAILFGHSDKIVIALLQLLTIVLLFLAGSQNHLSYGYSTSLTIIAVLFVYQQHLLRYRENKQCFKAFLNNHWVGMAVFLGIVADTSVPLP